MLSYLPGMWGVDPGIGRRCSDALVGKAVPYLARPRCREHVQCCLLWAEFQTLGSRQRHRLGCREEAPAVSQVTFPTVVQEGPTTVKGPK